MNICIPVYDDVDLLDVTGPYEMFTWGGLTVELVAAGPGPIRSRNNFYFFVDKSFSEASPSDVLWVPGGAPDALAAQMSDPSRIYLDFLIRQSAQSKWTASVCEGALLLAAAGLLDGYEATTHWAFAACMDRFPKVKLVPGHPRFVVDRDRITGGGISSGLDEALKVIELLQGTQAAQDAQLNTQYYPCPPVSSTIPDTPPACIVPNVTIPPPKGAASG
jgi:transcriptional regulator GlxA family with amidase domain